MRGKMSYNDAEIEAKLQKIYTSLEQKTKAD
jgi:hypothetical protein